MTKTGKLHEFVVVCPDCEREVSFSAPTGKAAETALKTKHNMRKVKGEWHCNSCVENKQMFGDDE